MRWGDQRQSDNVEDDRGIGGRGLAVGGGGIGILVLALVIWLCGGDPSQLFQNGPAQSEVPAPGTAANRAAVSPDKNRKFAGAIMGNLEDAWKQILPAQAHVQFRARSRSHMETPPANGRNGARYDGRSVAASEAKSLP